MLVRVSTSAGVWGIEAHWLTFQDPTPYEINLDSLPAAESDAFKSALMDGTLYEVDEKGRRLSARTSRKDSFTPLPAEITARKGNPFVDRKMQAILDANVQTIRREISLIKEPLHLEAAKQLEMLGKNRKGVLDLISKQAAKVAPPSAGGTINYDNDIVESEQEVIVCEVQRFNIEHSEKTSEIKAVSAPAGSE